MSNVYLVYWCNNEPYEDYGEDVEAVFSSYDKAVAYIEDKGYTPRVCESEWERKLFSERFDKKVNEWEIWSMWVREMSVQ